MAKDFESLKQQALVVKNEVEDGANSSERIGSILEDILDFNNDKLIELANNVGLYNVDKHVPLGGGFYTSATARAAVPSDVRKIGLIITYKTDVTTSVTEQFIGSDVSGWTTDANWKNVGSEGGNKILEWKTDAATTRKKVPVKERKAGMQISYKPTDSDWVNEQYVGTSFTDTEWVKDSNWEKIPKQKQLTELDISAVKLNSIFNVIYNDKVQTVGSWYSIKFEEPINVGTILYCKLSNFGNNDYIIQIGNSDRTDVIELARNNGDTTVKKEINKEIEYLWINTYYSLGFIALYTDDNDNIKKNIENIKIQNEEIIPALQNITNLDIIDSNNVSKGIIYDNKGIDNTGNIISLNWYLCVLPVKPSTQYYIYSQNYNSTSVGALGYSNTDEPEGKLNFIKMESLPDADSCKIYTTNKDTNYLFINTKPGSVDLRGKIIISEDKPEFSTTTKGERYLRNEIEKLKDETSSVSTKFKDKVLYVFGDSITWLSLNNGINNGTKGWLTYFIEKLQFKKVVNYARSGAAWTNTDKTGYNITSVDTTPTDDNVIFNQLNRMLHDISIGADLPDYILILAGTNDGLFPSRAPQLLNKTAKDVFEDEDTDYSAIEVNSCTTLAQSIRYVAQMILDNTPNAQVILTTPLQSTQIKHEMNTNISKIIEQCANYMSWNVINQSKECGINRIQELQGFYKTYDGVHTSVIGAKDVGLFIAAKFLSLAIA